MNQLKKSLEKHVLNEEAIYYRIRSVGTRRVAERRIPMQKKLLWAAGLAVALIVAIIASVSLFTPPVLKQTADTLPATSAQVAEVQSTAYAMVSIDINPSFEIYIGKKGIVEKIDAVNGDAKAVVDEYPDAFKAMIGMKVGEVSREIIKLAAAEGYIIEEDSEDDFVIISTVVLDDNDPEREANQESIGSLIKEALSEEGALDDSTKVEIIKATLREKFASDGKKTPLGLYILKGMYTGPGADSGSMKVSDYMKDRDVLAKLEQRAIKVEARSDAKETRQSEKQATKESREEARETKETGKPEDPENNGIGNT